LFDSPCQDADVRRLLKRQPLHTTDFLPNLRKKTRF